MANLKTQLLSLPQGEIIGVIRETLYDVPYYSFEGIPYAKPPLGELRFKAPQPAEPWKGIKDCTTAPNKPMQNNVMAGGVIQGSEDCLYLNVYAKKLKSDKPLPVMVYIYGGGFFMGEASREFNSPDYFMREDIIIVTINYRLCSLGFLSLKDPELHVPGNAGLRDQVLALKWIKQYISHFNGDADNITVFGQSAGAVSIHYLTAINQARGLFHKAILQSGTILNNWASKPPLDFAYRLAKLHGYEGENIDKTVFAYLCTLEASQLVQHDLLTDAEYRNGYMFAFGPTVEPYINGDSLLTKAPLEMLKSAWGNEIPIMLGGTSAEGLLLYMRLKMFPQSMNLMVNEPERILPQDVRDSHTVDENKVLSEKLIKLHFDDIEPNDQALTNYLDLFSYKTFWHGIHRSAFSRVEYAPETPTYLYRFDFDSPEFNLYRKRFCGQDNIRGVAHCDDLSYLFYSIDAWKLAEDTAEYKTIQTMVGIWTAFAKNSNPNCKEAMSAEWQPLQKSDPNEVLNISHEVKVMELPEKAKLNVWDKLYKRADLY